MRNRVEVISGIYRGRFLKVPKGIRPTQHVVRRSLFDSLGRWIEGRAVLEVFAGSGAIGLEALSRGANRVVFIEKSRQSFLTLLENIKNLGLSKERAFAIKKDFQAGLKLLQKNMESFDLIFADPPYEFDKLEELFTLIVPLLKEDGLFVLETSKDQFKSFSKLKLEKEVKFGQTRLFYYSRISGEF